MREGAPIQFAAASSTSKHTVEPGDCTFQTEFAGEIRIDELVGITQETGDYARFIKAGGREPRLSGFADPKLRFYNESDFHIFHSAGSRNRELSQGIRSPH